MVRTVAGRELTVVQGPKEMRNSSRVPEYDDTSVPLTGINTSVGFDQEPIHRQMMQQ